MIAGSRGRTDRLFTPRPACGGSTRRPRRPYLTKNADAKRRLCTPSPQADGVAGGGKPRKGAAPVRAPPPPPPPPQGGRGGRQRSRPRPRHFNIAFRG